MCVPAHLAVLHHSMAKFCIKSVSTKHVDLTLSRIDLTSIIDA